MPQETSYPDPSQLRAFAREPMPFHEVHAKDLELLDDGTLRHGAESVEYRWPAEYINVETASEEWERLKDVSYFDMTHREAWNQSGDTEVTEDYVCATGMPNDPRSRVLFFEAYWILGSITIERSRE